MRKIGLLLILCIFLVSCNFPVRSLSGIFRPRATLDQSIFNRVRTSTPTPGAALVQSTPVPVDQEKFISYSAQSGDTLLAVARHFRVLESQITSPIVIPLSGLIPPGQQLIIPRTPDNSSLHEVILPDSAVIYSSCARSFDIYSFVAQSGGYLNFHEQVAANKVRRGAEIVEFVAQNTSVDPRLLLAFIDFRSQWVYSYTSTPELTNPLGLNSQYHEGFYLELALAARMINTGYYAWRQGEMTEITFIDGRSLRIAPGLNAGSVGIEYLFAQLYTADEWEYQLYGEGGFIQLYANMIGNPWDCAAEVEPLFPADIQVPILELPFAAGETWSFTGGLHRAWDTGTPMGALDFSPNLEEDACSVSAAWVTALANGVITRSSDGMVISSLEDQEGQLTGWEVIYMHVAEKDRVPLGANVRVNDPIGHPSCEGGVSTGTHLHITRKYKGEWIGAGDPFPFIVSGWLAMPGVQIYNSTLVKDGYTVTARSGGSPGSNITR